MNLTLHPSVLSFLGSLVLSQFLLLLVLPFPSFSPLDLPSPPRDQRVLSIWSGAVTHHSAKVVAQLSAQAEVRLLVSTDPEDFSSPQFSEPQTVKPSDHHFVTLSAENLQPQTHYWYRLEIDGEIHLAPNGLGHFKTFGKEAQSFDVAFGSCARTGSKSRIFNTIKRATPDLYLNTGDLHYGDVNTHCDSLQLRAMKAVLASPSQSNLYRHVPIAYMWDDHDFGPNNSSSTATCKEIAKAGYLRYVPHYPLGIQDTSVISQSFVMGRVRFVMTDLRSEKQRPEYNGCERLKVGSNFGSEEHLLWFESELLQAKAMGQVVAWVSGIPFIGIGGEDGNWCEEKDGWAGYPKERKRIANFIKTYNIPIFLLSGDAHMLAIDDGSHSDYADGGGASIPVFHAAPLDQYPSVKGGPYSHGSSAVTGQFGWMRVEDTGGDSIHIYWEGRDQWGKAVVSSSGIPLKHRFSYFLPPPEAEIVTAASQLWPNPSKDKLYLRLGEAWTSEAQVRIFDLKGKQLIDITLGHMIPVPDGSYGLNHQLRRGLYFLSVDQAQDTMVCRFLVE